jgi:hypothetical protein
MSPRYNPNSSNASANIPVFERDSYEFVLKKLKPTSKKKDVEGEQVDKTSIVATVECVSSGPMQGKVLPLYFGLGPEQVQFWKKFMIAVYDYPQNSDGEERFNLEILGTKDEGFEINDQGEVTYLGTYYKEALNRRFFGDAEVGMYKGNKQNQWNWRGLSSSIPSPETVGV